MLLGLYIPFCAFTVMGSCKYCQDEANVLFVDCAHMFSIISIT